MQDPSHTTTPDLHLAPPRARKRFGLVQHAPGPERPVARDRAGAQGGMMLMLLAGGAFWAAVATVFLLVRR